MTSDLLLIHSGPSFVLLFKISRTLNPLTADVQQAQKHCYMGRKYKVSEALFALKMDMSSSVMSLFITYIK